MKEEKKKRKKIERRPSNLEHVNFTHFLWFGVVPRTRTHAHIHHIASSANLSTKLH